MAKRMTRAQLEAALKDEQDTTAALREKVRGLQGLVSNHEDHNTELRSRIDDLKTRLAHAEATNNEMKGYIARVQEDDVVREELVQVGDLAGEVNLVPKRKPHRFMQFADSRLSDSAIMNEALYERRRERRGHYVTY
jgi:chromosome segregation ATPase